MSLLSMLRENECYEMNEGRGSQSASAEEGPRATFYAVIAAV